MDRRRYLALTASAFVVGCFGIGEDRNPDGQTTTSTSTTTTTTTTNETTVADPFGPAEFSGQGAAAPAEIQLSSGPVTAEYSHSGYGDFVVELAPPGDAAALRLVERQGKVAESQVASVSAGSYRVRVDAKGTWQLTLDQPADPPIQSLPIEASGTGSTYLGPFGFEGQTTFEGSHDGNEDFSVETVPVESTGSSTVVFDTSADFEGSTTQSVTGAAYVNVVASGDWTLATKS